MHHGQKVIFRPHPFEGLDFASAIKLIRTKKPFWSWYTNNYFLQMQNYKSAFYFCLRCYKQLKVFYKFASHCMKSKNILKSYIIDLITHCDENLGQFNFAVSLENIDPENRICDTVTANPTSQKTERNPKETTLKIINIRSTPQVVNNNIKTSSTSREKKPLDDTFLKKMGKKFEHQNEATFNIERLIKNGDISLSVLSDNEPKTVVKEEILEVEDEEYREQSYEEEYQQPLYPEGNFQEDSVPVENPETFNNKPFNAIPLHQRVKKRKKFSLSPIKRYVCRICYKNFATPKNLQVHHMTHTDERPHGCNICGKRFRQLPHLNTHMMIHLNVRPFKCRICKKTFRQSAHLRAHELLHSDAKMFKCDICMKMYRSDANLRSHRKLVHFRKECGYEYVM